MAIFYIDAGSGSDSNDGGAPDRAWHSIDLVNQQNFNSGDTVLFRSGDVYRGTLEPGSSGTNANPITFGSYGDGPAPVITARNGSDDAIRIWNQDNIRIEGLEVSDSYQGVFVKNGRGIELIDLDVHGNERNGIHLKATQDSVVEGGSSHNNGTVDDPVKNTNLGHGVLLSNGSKNNQVSGMELYGNAEDGVQFSPDAGDGNLIRGNLMRGNLEDGIDSKNGSQTIEGNWIHHNASNAVLIHNNSGGDTVTLTGNRLQADNGNALDVSAGANIVSRNNIYEDGNGPAVDLRDVGEVSFKGDTVVNNGTYNGEWQFALYPGSGDDPATQPPVDEVVDDPEVVVDDPGSGGNGDAMIELEGSEGGDRIIGRGDDERLSGHGGDDILKGGSGNDVLEGGAANDRLVGGNGDDILDGGSGDDELIGGEGDDTYVFRPGSGTAVVKGFEPRVDSIDLSGWEGMDTDALMSRAMQSGAHVEFSFDDGSRLTVTQTEIADVMESVQLSGSPATQPPVDEVVDEPEVVVDDPGSGGNGDAMIELEGSESGDRIIGRGDDEHLSGHGGDDILKGGSGNDVLEGGAANDRLVGGNGDDILDGGSGDDELIGGEGADTYVFGPGSGTAVVKGFEPRVDSIDLSGWEGMDTDALMSRAMQSGAHVEFSFDDGSRLTVTQTEIADILESIRVAEGDAIAVGAADVAGAVDDADIAASTVADVDMSTA